MTKKHQICAYEMQRYLRNYLGVDIWWWASTLRDYTERHNLEQLKGFLKRNQIPNGLFLLLLWPLETPKHFHVPFFFSSPPSLSICSMSPWTWETIKLVADQRGQPQWPQTLQTHQMWCHVISIASSPYALTSLLFSSKLDQIGQGATEKDGEEWGEEWEGGVMPGISPRHDFFKGIDFKHKCDPLHNRQGARQWLWTLFPSTMAKQRRQTETGLNLI